MIWVFQQEFTLFILLIRKFFQCNKQEPHTKIKEFCLSKYSKEYAHRECIVLLCKYTKVLTEYVTTMFTTRVTTASMTISNFQSKNSNGKMLITQPDNEIETIITNHLLQTLRRAILCISWLHSRSYLFIYFLHYSSGYSFILVCSYFLCNFYFYFLRNLCNDPP